MNAIDDLINGTSSDDAFHRHCEAHFTPDPVPLGFELGDVEVAQLAYESLPRDRGALVGRFGIDALVATPTIAAQRRQPN